MAACDRTPPPAQDTQTILHVRDTSDANVTIIDEYLVDALSTHKFSHVLDETKIIGFRSTIIEHVGGPDDGEYRGIYVSRENDGWGFGGYDAAAALVTPCDDDVSNFVIHNHSHETRKITIYLSDQ